MRKNSFTTVCNDQRKREYREQVVSPRSRR
uniref:Uncharacterized protein n=1 Tax=Arundo donax TaxID=35708 RepID=A0A0A8YW16_ARUDO